jgi:hypothetical protein
MQRKSKWLLSLCLLFIFCCTPLVSHAASTDGQLVDDSFKQKLEQTKKKADILDRFLIGQTENLFNIGGVNSIQNLVFGNPYQVWMKDSSGDLKYGLFYDSEWNKVIRPMISFFQASYTGFVTISIMVACLKFGLKAYSPQAKADFWTDVNMWVLSAFFMGMFGWITEIMFGLNEGITQGIKDLLTNAGIDTKGISIIAYADGFSIGDIFVFLAEWGLALYMNVIYVARKIVILLLLILGPIAAVSLLYARTRSFFTSWLKEMAGNVFLQSIHAITLGLFAGIAGMGAGSIFKLGMIIMFIPVTGMISKWLNLGDSSSALGRAATMTGLGGVMGAVTLAKGAGSVMKQRGGNAGSTGDTPSASGDLGSDASGTNISANASGKHSPIWQRARQAMSLAGGVAGATMGLPLGPAGVALGGAIGSKVGKGLLQAPRNISTGVAQAISTMKNMPMSFSEGEGGWSGFKKGFGNMWGELSSRRQFMGNMGESLGSLAGLGESGRKIGQMMSGVSRSRIQQEQFGNKTLDDYARENPGANVQWRQDNQGSAFYMQDGSNPSQWRRISALGAADSSLKTGEQRLVDYKLNDGTPWARSENGSYRAMPSTSTSMSIPIYGANGTTISTVSPPSGYSGTTSLGNSGSQPFSVNNTGSGSVGTSTPTTTMGGTPQPIGTTPSSVGTVSQTVNPSGTTPSSAGSGPHIVGLSGSTPYLGRSTGSYVQGTDGKVHQDARVDAKQINPDQYFNHTAPGSGGRRSLSESGANFIHKTAQVTRNAFNKTPQSTAQSQSWVGNSVLNQNQNRHSGII